MPKRKLDLVKSVDAVPLARLPASEHWLENVKLAPERRRAAMQPLRVLVGWLALVQMWARAPVERRKIHFLNFGQPPRISSAHIMTSKVGCALLPGTQELN